MEISEALVDIFFQNSFTIHQGPINKTQWTVMKIVLNSFVLFWKTINTYGWSRTFHCNICRHSLYPFGLIGMSICTWQKETITGTIRAFCDNLSNQDARSYVLGFSSGDCCSYMIRAMVDCDVLRTDNICF